MGGLAPGVQGATTAGIHGIGVKTPIAAEVADATVGLAMLVHIPNGGMFTNGTKSIIVPRGLPDTITLLSGNTIRLEGAIPKVQVSVAPAVTTGSIAILVSLILLYARYRLSLVSFDFCYAINWMLT